ncbi:MAG: hypothetical protein ABI588_01160 [Arenimonas sp.]
MRTFLPFAASLFAAFAALAAEPVDNCATMLGSLSVELRYARALPPGRNTTFVCPKRFQPLVGASRARILRSLGPPDLNQPDQGWSYFFAGTRATRGPGTPELVFHFDAAQQVSGIDCHRLPVLAPAPSAAPASESDSAG